MIQQQFTSGGVRRKRAGGAVLAFTALLCVPLAAQALPVFNRQTGQNCVACHAGGQFPELTPYGRLFKMTGYTIGQRAFPLSVMGVLGYSKVKDISKSGNPPTDFAKNGAPLFSSGSLFAAGKITDNIGIFAQMTYDNYSGLSTTSDGTAGYWQGHTSADNVDLRWADRFINPTADDLIVGVSMNNNPSVTDPWNTAPAWMQYVPTPSPGSSQFADAAIYGNYGPSNSGLQVAGATFYAFWKKTVYAELGTFQTANKGFSFLSTGTNDAGTTKLRGSNNPYWRFALSHEWGPHNIMVGTSGMIAHVFDGADTSNPDFLGRVKTNVFDAQYQYLLDPHTVTAQFAYVRQVQEYSPDTVGGTPTFFNSDGSQTPVNASDTTNTLRTKLTYTYQAKYGGSLGFFNRTGTTNTLNQTSGLDGTGAFDTANSVPLGNLSGNPATRGWTYEAFWIPIQNVRVGAQYTMYDKFNGAKDNYDGFGRNAKDNDTLFVYVWGAY